MSLDCSAPDPWIGAFGEDTLVEWKALCRCLGGQCCPLQPSPVQASQHVCLLPVSPRPTVGLLLQIFGSYSALGCTPMLTQPAVSLPSSHQQPRDFSDGEVPKIT